ncbi:MAG: HAMP domain-containing histidine kinase, partial [Gammaproteobacteria bacterium]|nr:HAMP domain-containing histidine kinase [Gammaproteobacteria bacterium]
AEQLTEMERNARQYQVLEDPSLLQIYEEKQLRLLNNIKVLRSLDQDLPMDEYLARIQRDSANVFFDLSRYAPKSFESEKALETLAGLKFVASTVVSESWRMIHTELESLQDASRKTRYGLGLQAAALILGTIVLVLFFTALIVRPIRQVGRAIRQLGEGNFDQAVTITGPPEFAALGHELDWLRRRLDELERAKSKFLQHMSHELKTPLASIREGTELLVDGTLGSLNVTQVEVAQLLRDNSLELQGLIENILDFGARRELGNLEMTHFGLSSIIDEIKQHHRLLLRSKRLSLNVCGEELILAADREKIVRALKNLLSNAIKFAPRGSEIKVEARCAEDGVLIDIADQGPGVSERDQNFIFEPFYKGGDPQDSYVAGTGLGLSVTRDCIAFHGGTVGVVEAPVGARFRILLPSTVVANDS